MKNLFYTPIIKHKLNIQLFGDEPGDPQTGGNSNELTIDDFMSKFKPEDILGHASMTSALDRRISKATDTAINNARAKWEQEQNQNLSEAEKLAKMSKEEKERYRFQKDQDQFLKDKAAFEREKLVVATGNELNTLNVDPALAEFIVGKDAEETKTRMETFTKIFNSAVEKAIDSKLKGGAPMKKAPDSKGYTLDQIKAMTPAEINANWAEVQQALKNN